MPEFGISGNQYGGTGISGTKYTTQSYNPVANIRTQGTSMPIDPVSATLTGVGIVGNIFGSLFGGDDPPPDPNAKELTPELEFEMLMAHERFMDNARKTVERMDSFTTEYRNRLDLISQGLNNLIPSDELQKQLAESTGRIAQGLGLSAEELLKNNFLTQDDMNDLQSLKDLDKLTSSELVAQDETLQKERAKLEQDLAAKGAPKSVRLQALRDFDMQAGETVRAGRFDRGTSLIGTRASLREQGYNQTIGGMNALQAELARIQGIRGQQAALESERFAAGGSTEAYRLGVDQAVQGRFDSLGKYKFTDRGRSLMHEGALGPGSIDQQLAKKLGLASTAAGGSYNESFFNQRLYSGRYNELSKGDISGFLANKNQRGQPGQLRENLERMLNNDGYAAEIRKRAFNKSSDEDIKLLNLYDLYRK